VFPAFPLSKVTLGQMRKIGIHLIIYPAEVSMDRIRIGYPAGQWCSRDRNLRDRDLAQISRRDWDLEVRDRDTRPHISLMVIKANSLNNPVTKYLAHCQISR